MPVRPLRMITYNIVSAGGNRLNMALRAMNHMHIDLGFLTETKLHHDKYTKNCDGYTIHSTRTNGYQGGVAIFYRNSSQWTIEGIKDFGPNIIRCKIVSGNKRWTCIGVYIPPSETDGETLNWLEQATRNITSKLILMGDLNCNFSAPKDERASDISHAISILNLSDVANHFPHPRGKWTWSQNREGRYIRSTIDYVLADNPLEFTRWVIKIPRFNSDHRAIVTELSVQSNREHRVYVRQRKQFPIQDDTPTTVDKMFEHLRCSLETPKPFDQRDNSWISKETWSLIDRRYELVHKHRTRHHICDVPVSSRTRSHDNPFVQRDAPQGDCCRNCKAIFKDISRRIRKSLKQDRKARAAKVGAEAEAFLANGEIHEAYRTIRGWYRKVTHVPSKPEYVNLQKESKSYQQLYTATTPRGRPLPVNITAYAINDAIPDETEITQALHRLRLGRAPGPSSMTAEALLQWKNANSIDWKILVQLVQQSFTGHQIPLAYARAILVLVPKKDPNTFRGITLLEVLYKLWGMIVHQRAMSVIQFHPGIHGFRHGRGTGTAILEAKLEMQWATVQSLPYFQIFLDLTKAFDSIDRDRLLDILAGYGFGPNIIRFLRTNWNNAKVVLRQMGYFGPPIDSDKGIWQGDVLSPLFLNIIVDCILREWDSRLSKQIIGIFYADDGRLADFDHDSLQRALDILLELFARVGMFPNIDKTKAMISLGHRHPNTESSAAFKRRYDVSLPSHCDRKRRKVTCPHCQKSLSAQYMPTHIRHIHHMVLDSVAAPQETPTTPPTTKRQCIIHVPSCYDIDLSADIIVCPVPDCPTWTPDPAIIKHHLCSRHPLDEFRFHGAHPLTQCKHCGLYMTKITRRHSQSHYCKQFSTRREHAKARLQLAQAAEDAVPFTINGGNIKFVDSFEYLGRVLSSDDSDDMAAFKRLEKAKKVWGQFSQLLKGQGASTETMGRFYRTIIHATLLYGSSTWVLSNVALNRLERFQARCARGMAHRPIQRRSDGTWIHPHTAEVLQECHIRPLHVYIDRRRHRLYQRYAATESPLFQKCSSATCSQRLTGWWTLRLTSDVADK